LESGLPGRMSSGKRALRRRRSSMAVSGKALSAHKPFDFSARLAGVVLRIAVTRQPFVAHLRRQRKCLVAVHRAANGYEIWSVSGRRVDLGSQFRMFLQNRCHLMFSLILTVIGKGDYPPLTAGSRDTIATYRWSPGRCDRRARRRRFRSIAINHRLRRGRGLRSAAFTCRTMMQKMPSEPQNQNHRESDRNDPSSSRARAAYLLVERTMAAVCLRWRFNAFRWRRQRNCW
jgi:hypothetical protein